MHFHPHLFYIISECWSVVESEERLFFLTTVRVTQRLGGIYTLQDCVAIFNLIRRVVMLWLFYAYL